MSGGSHGSYGWSPSGKKNAEYDSVDDDNLMNLLSIKGDGTKGDGGTGFTKRGVMHSNGGIALVSVIAGVVINTVMSDPNMDSISWKRFSKSAGNMKGNTYDWVKKKLGMEEATGITPIAYIQGAFNEIRPAGDNTPFETTNVQDAHFLHFALLIVKMISSNTGIAIRDFFNKRDGLNMSIAQLVLTFWDDAHNEYEALIEGKGIYIVYLLLCLPCIDIYILASHYFPLYHYYHRKTCS